MKRMKTLLKLFLGLSVMLLVSCEGTLTDLNVNPQGVNPETVQPNLMVTTVITSTANPYLKNGYDGWVAGVMQYVQKSGWGEELNKYEWNSESDWNGYYSILRNLDHLYTRAGEEGMEFQQGLSIVLRAFNFAFIADTWGDAPYTNALNALTGEQEDLFPAFDSQEVIYLGIIEELKEANTLLSKSEGDYTGIDAAADVIYSGDPVKWRKMANSLMLRYYMRISSKLPAVAKAGIEEIAGNPSQFPIFTSTEDDATMGYIGSYDGDSWPAAIAFNASESNFNRIQLCAGFRDVLLDLNDPRIAVWFNKVRVPIKVSTAHSPEADITVDGVRYIHPDSMLARDWTVYDQDTWVDDINNDLLLVDTMEYAGLPIASTTGNGNGWNLNPNPIQGGFNIHNSALADMYKDSEGDMLKARLISYAEVCFIMAEAANMGYTVGSEKQWYENGVEASFETWGVADDYAAYDAGPDVSWDGTLEQIMVQKWIANWTVAHESWCDWRRTGFPDLTVGPKGTRDAMPLRRQYGGSEKASNNANYNDAILSLEESAFTAQDGKDSAWSLFWLLK